MTPISQPGWSLAQLIAVRRTLAAGEVVTLGVALAFALADLHDRGEAHGSVGPDAVRFNVDGQPLLTPGAPAPETAKPGSAAGDLDDLLAVLRGVLPERAPPVLRAALGSAADAAAVPTDARTLARRLLAAWPAEPIRFASGVEQAHRRHRAAVAVAAGSALLLAGTLVTLTARSPSTARTEAASPIARPSATSTTAAPATTPTARTVPAVGWVSVVRRLDALRARAFTRLDPGLLRQVYVQGSAPWRSDRASLAALRRQRLRVSGLRVAVVEVRALHEAVRRTVVRVVDRRGAYTVIDAAGAVVARRAARGQRSWRMTLQQQQGEWLIAEVARA